MFKILGVKSETKVVSKEVLRRNQEKNYIGLREEIVSYKKGYLRWAWKMNLISTITWKFRKEGSNMRKDQKHRSVLVLKVYTFLKH